MHTRYDIKTRPIISDVELAEDISPVLRRVYQRREIKNLEELNNSLRELHAIEHLSGIDKAVELLSTAIQANKHILIVGDFDADGATSTAVAIRSLKQMGAKRVGYLVPDRFKFGYGLTPEIVAVAKAQQPDLIVTVDNGIASVAGVAAAVASGIQVIITDHHLPAEQLPEADAIVNPNMHDDPFPSKALAGVGVIFYVMSALRALLRAEGWFEQAGINEPNLAQWLDLVALGTVADVVTLDANNRIMVEQGLRRIRAGCCIPGIKALLRQGKRAMHSCVSSDLAFAVAPRLNAAGRLEDMSLGIECLLTDDESRAESLAQQLDDLNHQRREIESDMREQADAALLELSSQLDDKGLPAAVVLYDERWHQGVIGILAARIKEKIHRPVIAFAKDDNNVVKGSARSITGLHIRDALDAVAASNPGLIVKFGGHAMAAGLSIESDNLDAFKYAFIEQVERLADSPPGEAVIWTDGELRPEEIALTTAEALRQAGPWGQGFPEPCFDGIFEVCEKRIVGESHLKMQLQLPGGTRRLDAIAFNETGESWDSERIRVAYKLEVNEFRNNRTVQLNVQYLEEV